MIEAPAQVSRNQPLIVRVIPFFVFVGLTACQGLLGEASRYWVYAGKTLVGVGLLCAMYPWVSEMRWKMSWAAVVAGIGVFGIWVGLDGLYPSLDAFAKQLLCPVLKHLGMNQWCSTVSQPAKPWNPHAEFGPGLAWVLALIRLFGSTLVVPPMEEVFYRSFLYRYIAKAEFERVALNTFAWQPFLLTSVIFGLVHHEWVAGILCGMIYQGLVLWKNRLGDAMTAHAITNFLLGVWVIWKGAWHFW